MTTKNNTYHIDVRGHTIQVTRKDIKNFYISVHPPNGQIRVSAPKRLDDDAIRLAIISRLGWIKRKQTAFAQQERQTQREFVTGESHYFAGRRYRLDVTEQNCPPNVHIRNNKRIALTLRPDTDRDKREAIFHAWYRQHLKSQIPPLLTKWQPKTGVTVNEVRIKKMKTLWGSCNIEAKRIWLNLELAKKPNTCLVYVLVHEMAHLLERHHNDRFRELMDTFLPQWRTYRDELNKAPLTHENWKY